MDMGLGNKTALVTGSTKGIGRATAFELAREGVHILVNGRDPEEVERTVRELKQEFPATSPQNASRFGGPAAKKRLVGAVSRGRYFD